jgi:hypothetical protein
MGSKSRRVRWPAETDLVDQDNDAQDFFLLPAELIPERSIPALAKSPPFQVDV